MVLVEAEVAADRFEIRTTQCGAEFVLVLNATGFFHGRIQQIDHVVHESCIEHRIAAELLGGTPRRKRYWVGLLSCAHQGVRQFGAKGQHPRSP